MKGKNIFNYTIDSLLGEGGMAQVWLAYNNLNKPAAIKILHQELIRNSSAKERFIGVESIKSSSILCRAIDKTGKELFVKQYNSGQSIIEIDVSSLLPGMYTLSIETDQTVLTKRIVKL